MVSRRRTGTAAAPAAPAATLAGFLGGLRLLGLFRDGLVGSFQRDGFPGLDRLAALTAAAATTATAAAAAAASLAVPFRLGFASLAL